jgi:hypothetical protein
MEQQQSFLDISIFPSHAKRTAIVAWTTIPALKQAEFYIYRKWDGGAEWELLNTSPATGTTYADTTFAVRNKEQVPSYKILAIVDGKEFVSPEVALFTKAGRKAFGIAHNIIRAKYFQARQDGIPVLYYPSRKNGPMNASLDAVTGQRVLAPCPQNNSTSPDDDADNDYGTYYAGGYYRPFITFIRLMGAKLQRENRLDDGVYDESVQQTSFLAFPPVRSGDMVVDVATDRRWFVGESIRAEMVKGVIPVGYTANLTLQAHNHPCYTVPIPNNYSEMLRQLVWPST